MDHLHIYFFIASMKHHATPAIYFLSLFFGFIGLDV